MHQTGSKLQGWSIPQRLAGPAGRLGAGWEPEESPSPGFLGVMRSTKIRAGIRPIPVVSHWGGGAVEQKERGIRRNLPGHPRRANASLVRCWDGNRWSRVLAGSRRCAPRRVRRRRHWPATAAPTKHPCRSLAVASIGGKLRHLLDGFPAVGHAARVDHDLPRPPALFQACEDLCQREWPLGTACDSDSPQGGGAVHPKMIKSAEAIRNGVSRRSRRQGKIKESSLPNPRGRV